MLSTKISSLLFHKATFPVYISSRSVSKLTYNKLEKAKHTHINEFPPILVPKKTEEKSTTVGDLVIKSTRYDHPLPEYFNPREPEQQLEKGKLFAICNVNGTQYKVTENDRIMVSKLKGVEVGEKLAFDQVLLLAGRDFTVVGQPFVQGAAVVATCEEQTQTKLLNIFKAKKRTGYKRLMRYRDQVTILRIDSVIAQE